ncbi:MAG: methyl-accepting chemotaxis protein [Fusobacteriaceae bacterium]|jgi:methyl-accepting chemotaxis protein|nr:methyl-accepting chemotaxis protein [Fusobacteriales bacterium]MDN5303711.1 methyl-accepting chemotaxis protein [Fusobacteriaceae bacterium]
MDNVMILENVKQKRINFLKNVKIKNLLLAVGIIIILSMSYLTFSSLNRMKTLNNDMNSLYNKNMLVSLNLKEFETEFYIIRIKNLEMLYSNYKESLVNNINSTTNKIDNILNTYANYNLTDEERELFNNIKKYYLLYIEDMKKYFEIMKSGEKISEEKIDILRDYVVKVQENIDKLVSLNAEHANNVVIKANNIYITFLKNNF